ncbi:MAG: sigma-70 family RNA polymerase sigma factor [Candidatus Marinimicrobia bacterium]|nr:sigma-70 family RNA polymerase sigma factor [Candidatus Neomarinimicrobiota bacterium]MBL7010977.1 sigma-70 family RNA polymerase sigma factor [Candidatus Neomarinimicrobiota bacterium]MBL7031123.1 sigma-70 family RNA polymerase sigma factor [Candidatus Neomarinimicrobiota bacterium]
MDNKVFTELVHKFGDKIYTIAYHTLQDETAAEDISQEVFIKIYKNFHRFRGDSKLSTWIYRITKNTCYNFLKREKKYREMDDVDTAAYLSNEDSLEETMEQKYMHLDLHKAVGRLSPNLRLSISLYYFNDHSYQEVSDIMNIPLNTLKSHIRRAKFELAKMLEIK